MTCYDCIHCDRCNDIEGGFSCHCSDARKCKHFKNKADYVEVPYIAQIILDETGYKITCALQPYEVHRGEWIDSKPLHKMEIERIIFAVIDKLREKYMHRKDERGDT